MIAVDDNSALVQLACDRLVQSFSPVQIILFGSRAREAHCTESDIDLLVVMDQLLDKRAVAVAMRRQLRDLPVGKDVIVTTPDELAERENVIGSVLRSALKEGRVVFERHQLVEDLF